MEDNIINYIDSMRSLTEEQKDEVKEIRLLMHEINAVCQNKKLITIFNAFDFLKEFYTIHTKTQ